MRSRFPILPALWCAVLLLPLSAHAEEEEVRNPLPKGFVNVGEEVPEIQLELRYCTRDNFVGTPIDGYEAAVCIATKQTATALKKVQEELKPFGLSLKIFDAYRPQRAVDHFVRWAKDTQNTKTKQNYYPRVAKKDLLPDYIAPRSSHTRGSAVDVTLVSLDGEELDMGTPFDFFDKKSWSQHPKATTAQRAHRMLLRTVMVKHGFKPYVQEWWHFSLENEPFPDTYFDFPIRN